MEFKDVSFKYPGSDLWALRHVNMKFKVGKRLAIVGENGSGMETFRLDDFPFVFHTVDHCRELFGKAGIQIVHEVASDGASELLQDLVNSLDEASYQQYLRCHFYIWRNPNFWA